MSAMIPYFEQPILRLGPISIHAFGVMVAIAIMTGLRIGERRFERLGLDAAIGQRMGWWAIAGGVIGAQLFSVLFYFPHKVAENPLVLLKVWEDISSFGSIIGGVLGVALFFALRRQDIEPGLRLRYLDVAVF